MHILSSLLLVSALALGLVEATPTRTTELKARTGGGKSSKSCSKKEFFWETRSCCLPSGGPSKLPTPPSGIGCPNSWYFYYEQGACVPLNKPSKPATPTCGKGLKWFPSLQCCSKGNPPTSSPPVPSSKPKSKKNDKDKYKDHKGHEWSKEKKDHERKDYGREHNKKDFDKDRRDTTSYNKIKRNFDQWDVSFCPSGLAACPIKVDGLLTGDSECVDTLSDLVSCGGCASLGEGTDCSTIPGSSCLGGVCVVNA